MSADQRTDQAATAYMCAYAELHIAKVNEHAKYDAALEAGVTVEQLDAARRVVDKSANG